VNEAAAAVAGAGRTTQSYRHLVVQLAERPEDRQPHLVAGHLGRAGGADGLLDPLGELRQRVLVHRTALAGPAHPDDHLLPGERLGDAAALDHRQRRLLHGGEPPAAVLAGPAASDHLAVVDLARIDDAGVRMAAVRAAHGELPSGLRPIWVARASLRVTTTLGRSLRGAR